MGKYRVPGAYHPDDDQFVLPVSSDTLKDFKHLKLAIYIALCSYVKDETEIVTVSHSELARVCHCDSTTISTNLQKLEEMGYIEIIEWEHSRAEMSDVLRWRVFKRDGYKCVYCGKDNGPFEVDHVVPVSKGGRDNMKNLVTACPQCNRKKSNVDLEREFHNIAEQFNE